jgi:F-type H+-transporting ATPase subunit epsilon
MLPEFLSLEVVTPDRRLVQDSVRDLQLPSLDGYLGILPGHAPLLTELGVGELSYHKGGESFYLTVIHGFAEVLPDRVIVLAETSERAEEIDVARARISRERAQARLAKPGDTDMDWDRATFALQRAMVRLQVAAKGGAVAAGQESHQAVP